MNPQIEAEARKIRAVFAVINRAQVGDPTLTEITIRDVVLGNFGVAAVANALVHNTVVRSLSLRNCGITVIGVSYLKSYIERGTLVKLDLSHNIISGYSPNLVFIDMFRRNSNIRELNLSQCGLSGESLQSLFVELHRNEVPVTTLDLSWAIFMESTVVTPMVKYLRTVPMCSIALERAQIPPSDVARIIDALSAKSLSSLSRMVLSHVSMNKHAYVALRGFIVSCKQLCALHFSVDAPSAAQDECDAVFDCMAGAPNLRLNLLDISYGGKRFTTYQSTTIINAVGYMKTLKKLYAPFEGGLQVQCAVSAACKENASLEDIRGGAYKPDYPTRILLDNNKYVSRLFDKGMAPLGDGQQHNSGGDLAALPNEVLCMVAERLYPTASLLNLSWTCHLLRDNALSSYVAALRIPHSRGDRRFVFRAAIEEHDNKSMVQ